MPNGPHDVEAVDRQFPGRPGGIHSDERYGVIEAARGA
jgi:hypothetical protein